MIDDFGDPSKLKSAPTGDWCGTTDGGFPGLKRVLGEAFCTTLGRDARRCSGCGARRSAADLKRHPRSRRCPDCRS